MKEEGVAPRDKSKAAALREIQTEVYELTQKVANLRKQVPADIAAKVAQDASKSMQVIVAAAAEAVASEGREGNAVGAVVVEDGQEGGATGGRGALPRPG